MTNKFKAQNTRSRVGFKLDGMKLIISEKVHNTINGKELNVLL